VKDLHYRVSGLADHMPPMFTLIDYFKPDQPINIVYGPFSLAIYRLFTRASIFNRIINMFYQYKSELLLFIRKSDIFSEYIILHREW